MIQNDFIIQYYHCNFVAMLVINVSITVTVIIIFVTLIITIVTVVIDTEVVTMQSLLFFV